MADKTRVLIVDDSPETRENIRKLLQFEADIDVVDTARTGKEGVELAKKLKPNVVLMDINMPDMDGIQATTLIVRDVPSAQIVMVSVQSDTDYLRRAMLAGARDFLPKPPSPDELIGTIRRLGAISRESEAKLAAAPAVDGAGAKRRGALDGKLIAVYSPKGGAGCTTIAANLSIALFSEQTRTLAVDCNLQFGDLGVFFNLKDRDLKGKGLVNLITRGEEELDEDYLQSVLVAHASGAKVLPGPPTPEDAELVSAPIVKHLLSQLRHFFHYVVVDTAPVLGDRELSILDVSDRIVLVATPDIPSLANIKKFLDLAEKLEYPKDKIILILNRMDKRIGITPQGIEESIKHTVKGQILYDHNTVMTSINNGVPFITGSKNVPPYQGIIDLAAKVREEFAPKEEAEDKKKPAPARRSLFDRR